jgi:hypothetical protein
MATVLDYLPYPLLFTLLYPHTPFTVVKGAILQLHCYPMPYVYGQQLVLRLIQFSGIARRVSRYLEVRTYRTLDIWIFAIIGMLIRRYSGI